MGQTSLVKRESNTAEVFELVHARVLRFFPDLVAELVGDPKSLMSRSGVELDNLSDDESGATYRQLVHLIELAGDGGYVDEAGRLFWEGRLNDIIKTGGANVSPAEIDSVIQDCPGVKVTQTVGVPHETLGEMVVTCVVARDGAELDEDTVRDFARIKLASYKVPRRVLLFVEGDLQLTGSAKVKTGDLRKLAARILEEEATSLRPADV